MNAILKERTAERRIAFRTLGRTHGGITRFASPGDVGEQVKPFVFLDLFELKAAGHRMGMHPHSGIATVTVVTDGAMAYRETTGSAGVLRAGGVEWMSAGGGVWHEGGPADGEGVTGFQLWLALPPEDENGPTQSRHLAPGALQSAGPARVIIGALDGAESAIKPRASLNYLQVTLRAGETWRYAPPAGHDVAWVAVARGLLQTAGQTLEREMAVFEEGGGALEFHAPAEAKTITEFVLGSAVKHPHPLVTGYYSVHTNAGALERGENEIRRIGAQLRAANLL